VALVLCTGAYPPLLETRRLMIEQEGHVVLTAIYDREVVELCQRHTFDVVVIGQTSASLKRRAFMLVQEHCASAKVLELVVAGLGRELEAADAWLEVPVKDARELPQCVTDLAGRMKKKSARAQGASGGAARSKDWGAG
jgi:hypothetical protein